MRKLPVTLSVAHVLIEMPAAAPVVDLDMAYRAFLGQPHSGDPRLRCVGAHVYGRGENGNRLVRVVYLGVIEEEGP